MTLPRSVQINPEFTPYYHCVSRCVRRAFLCGEDPVTGFNFEHRRHWIEARILELAEIFAIDVCAYAVMNNHYHLVLRLNVNRQTVWTDNEVTMQWQRLHALPDNFDCLDTLATQRQIAIWRERLGSISWFMKSLNEPLARWANKEDGCKGRFWEGRFRSQALLDDAALLKCMAYVDLNPVRARIADTPEESNYTSIQARIQGRDHSLAALRHQPTRAHRSFSLPIRYDEYLSLVDWTGRHIRRGKRGAIAKVAPPIVQRLQGANDAVWRDEMMHLSRRYCRAIGSISSLFVYRESLGQQRLNGLTI
ncbi:MAG TPA: transposase [Woeseiaceae bacterium]|nr:transposase [Woeseiaceae bacterium]